MRRRNALIALVVVAVVAAGLLRMGAAGGNDAGARPSPLTPSELRWLRGYSRLSIEIDDADLETTAGREPLTDCAAVLRSTAGQAPTQRLQEAESFVEDACAALARGRPEAFVLEDLAHADDRLAPLLLSSAVLPETNEATVESRRSAILGAIATAHAGEEIEVQCWSDSDWRRVIREDNAWSDSEDDHTLVDGMAYVSQGRIQLLLGDCNLLGRLRDERIADRNREGLVDAAGALSIFSHEIQHFRLPDANEAAVECRGVAAFARVGRGLGLDGREIDLLREVYAESVRPQLADEYRSACPRS